jgi:cation diffusion facilitator CzcD-associated flavoprotein CzcO
LASASFNDAQSKWAVELIRDGAKRTIHPTHVAFCTGNAGEPKIPSFPGQSEFNGQVYHGIQHEEASKFDVKGKKVIVVGTGNSGHEIAENFYKSGADVMMLQRSGTYVISLDKGVFILHEGMYANDG